MTDILTKTTVVIYSPPIINLIGEIAKIAKEVGGHGGMDFILD